MKKRGAESGPDGERPSTAAKLSSCASLTVSAPGKVLVAGGYLVLERPNVGLVLASSARFYTTASWAAPEGDDALLVSVHSPQFGQDLRYKVVESAMEAPASSCLADRLGIGVLPVSAEQPDNTYVEHTISHTLAAVCALKKGSRLSDLLRLAKAAGGTHISVTLRADNDFYSQSVHLRRHSLPLSAAGLRKLPAFLPCPRNADGTLCIAKTGMGSSAALITSLTGALLSLLGAVGDVGDSGETGAEARRVVHIVAQACHAMAQGKVGSGFDVCAAVHGCNSYVRFSKDLLAPVLSCPPAASTSADSTDTATGTTTGLATVPPARLGACLDAEWDHDHGSFALPPGLDLLMGDVCGGSETPSMVRKVLAWKAGGGVVAAEQWRLLACANDEIAAAARVLHAAHAAAPAAYAAGLRACECSAASEWASVAPPPPPCDAAAFEWAGAGMGSLLFALRAAFARARDMLRRMGEAAGVPIEPAEQTALADATLALPGVLACGVPGAGGFDAVFAIVLSPAAGSRVEELWSTYGDRNGDSNGGVCPLVLRVDQHAGIRVEDEQSFANHVAEAEAATRALK